jgi:hypothetical protein
MFPNLSREAKIRAAMAEQQRAEQKMRNQQLAADLRELNQRLQQKEK